MSPSRTDYLLLKHSEYAWANLWICVGGISKKKQAVFFFLLIKIGFLPATY